MTAGLGFLFEVLVGYAACGAPWVQTDPFAV